MGAFGTWPLVVMLVWIGMFVQSLLKASQMPTGRYQTLLNPPGHRFQRLLRPALEAVTPKDLKVIGSAKLAFATLLRETVVDPLAFTYASQQVGLLSGRPPAVATSRQVKHSVLANGIPGRLQTAARQHSLQ